MRYLRLVFLCPESFRGRRGAHVIDRPHNSRPLFSSKIDRGQVRRRTRRGAPARLAVLLPVLFLAISTFGRAEFSLRREIRVPGQGGEGFSIPALAQDLPSTEPLAQRKHPWRAALEVFTLNMAVWSFDRFIMNQDYARIGPSTWASNFEHGFSFDPDTFGMNFLFHPFHGANYFNCARSQGLSFWASAPYALGGSLMWELFMEKQAPSPNDLIMTSTGGTYLGEMMYRLSSQVLDDTATGGRRFWREAAALLIDPARGLNRLLFGDAFRTSSVNRQLRGSIHGTLGIRPFFMAENATLTRLKFSPGLEFDFIYNSIRQDQPALSPFDLFFLNTAFRFTGGKLAFNLDSYALLVGKEYRTASGQRHMIGLFQNYDFVSNEIIHMGGSSLAAGLQSVYPLGRGAAFRVTAQLGAVLFGASNNRYTHIEERDYNYGLGSMSKVEAWLIHPTIGTLLVHFSHHQIYTIKAAAFRANVSQDFLTNVSARYGLLLSGNVGFRVEYTLFNRDLHFQGRPSYRTALSLIGASVFFVY